MLNSLAPREGSTPYGERGGHDRIGWLGLRLGCGGRAIALAFACTILEKSGRWIRARLNYRMFTRALRKVRAWCLQFPKFESQYVTKLRL